MTRDGKQLLERALELSPAERLKLAHELFDSVEPEADVEDDADLSPEWRQEIERRLADEPEPGKPWPSGDEVIARLRRELGDAGGS